MVEPSQPASVIPRRHSFAVSLFFACLFALSNSGFDNSEGLFHYQVARLFVDTGNIGFDQPQVGIFTTAPNGRTYASHEFGNVAMLIPMAAFNSATGKLMRERGIAEERI